MLCAIFKNKIYTLTIQQKLKFLFKFFLKRKNFRTISLLKVTDRQPATLTSLPLSHEFWWAPTEQLPFGTLSTSKIESWWHNEQSLQEIIPEWRRKYSLVHNKQVACTILYCKSRKENTLYEWETPKNISISKYLL